MPALPMEDKPAPFSSGLFGIALLCVFSSLVVPPSRFRVLFFFPILAIIAYLVVYTTSGTPSTDYLLACAIVPYVFIASDYILLTDVQRDLQLINQPEPAYKLPLLARVKWAATLLLSARGVGWKHEPVSVLPPRNPQHTSSRSKFVASRLFSAAKCFIAFDLAMIYARSLPCFATGGPSIGADGWLPRSVRIFAYTVPAATQIYQNHCILSVLVVLAGLSDPWSWPDIMGSIGDAYTVRRAWGRSWHQLLRRIFSSHGKWLAHDCLKLQPGGNPSSYVQLYLAFFISALIHYSGDYMMLRDWTGGSMRFFMSQAVAITFEDAVTALGKRHLGYQSSTRATRMIGYIWVWVWFTYSLVGWLDPLVHAGLMQDGLNVSLIQGILKGDWTPSWPAV